MKDFDCISVYKNSAKNTRDGDVQNKKHYWFFALSPWVFFHVPLR